ncbi:uncharacterized protein LOC132205245 [Neocloeon triangulifer]|uniref:uncharacterized protein LOC132205245 n=1 Tax=Neocloeon triangulifer TaxID=2078957 RepID=UPI00286F3CC2|nr:uncharacterized protein LOC132205245 [Neocloeon triangulifer]
MFGNLYEDPKWLGYLEAYDKKLSNALNEGRFVDCRFLVGPNKGDAEIICGYSALMRAASEKFDQLISAAGPLTSLTGLIRIENVEPNIFKKIIEFIHIKINITSDISCAKDAVALILAADEYQIEPLKYAMCTVLEGLITVDNVWLILNTIGHIPEAVSRCTEILCKETLRCLQHETFKIANETSFTVLLKLDNLNINSELDLVEASIKLNRFRPAAPLVSLEENVVRMALPYLRLLTLNTGQIACISEFLTREERFALASKMVFKEDRSVLPPKLNGNTQPRNRNKTLEMMKKGKVMLVTDELIKLKQMTKSTLYKVTTQFDRNIMTFRACHKMSVTAVEIITQAVTNWNTRFLSEGNERNKILKNRREYDENLSFVYRCWDGHVCISKGELPWAGKVNFNSTQVVTFKEAILIPKGCFFHLTIYFKQGATYHIISREKFIRGNCCAVNEKKEIIADCITWKHERVYKNWAIHGDQHGFHFKWNIGDKKAACIIKSIHFTVLD